MIKYITLSLLFVILSIGVTFSDMLESSYEKAASNKRVVESDGSGFFEGSNSYIAQFTNFLLRFAAVVGVVMTIYGGIMLILSIGDESKMQNARKQLVYVCVGIFIALSSVGIIQLLESTVSTFS